MQEFPSITLEDLRKMRIDHLTNWNDEAMRLNAKRVARSKRR